MFGPEELHDGYAKVDFPHTEYYVIYNGKKDLLVNETRWLSGLRRLSGENYPVALDLRVDIYNISTRNDPELLRRCEMLLHYQTFVELVQAREDELGLDAAAELAVKECLERGILVEILKKHGKGIISMLVKELNQVRLKEIWTEGARKEGWNEGRDEERKKNARAFKDKGVDVNTIADATGLSIDEVLRL